MRKTNERILTGFWIALILINSACKSHESYYVDTLNGNDSNDGKSPKYSWQSIDKVNSIHFKPGDNLLFRGDQIFEGTILFRAYNSGVEQNLITVSSYGNGRATISGGDTCAMVADSCRFISIRNLNFTGSGRKTGNLTSGLVVRKGSNIIIDSIDVSGFQKSGVDIIDAENVRLTHIHAFENGGTGICTGSVYYKPYQLLSKNIYIGYCVTENNPGDPTILDNHSGSGIIVSGTDGALVEYCLSKNNGWDQPWEGNGPIGIWAFHANNVIIQYCISHSNKSNPKGWDGGGFDFDGGVTNSIMQYNYSYNNVGPGYGLYQYWGAAPWENNTVRYNISINDGIENDSCGIQIWTGQPNIPDMKNALIYNNLIINTFGRAVGYKSGNIPGLLLCNNIFLSAQQPIYGEHSKSVFKNNLYWSFEGEMDVTHQDNYGLCEDPKLVLPEPLALPLEDPTKLMAIGFYMLKNDSPCLGKGTFISDNGGIDFWGNPLPDESRPANIGLWQGNK